MLKSVEIDGITYQMATIKVARAKQVQLSSKTGLEFSLALVDASLKAADESQSIDDLPYFELKSAINVACEVNYLKIPGEAAAGPKEVEPAGSTLPGSTAA